MAETSALATDSANELIDNSQQALRIWEIYRQALDARRASGFDSSTREAVDFVYGNQLTEKEHKEMQSVGIPDVVFDRIYGAIDRTIAFLTARTPTFTVLPREDSDQKLASTWRIILEYIWDISGGNGQFKDVMKDRAMSVGYMMGYIDREADAGRGEVKIKRLPRVTIHSRLPRSFEADKKLWDTIDKYYLSEEYHYIMNYNFIQITGINWLDICFRIMREIITDISV